MADDELIHKSAKFRVVRRRHHLADGTPTTRDCVLHPGAVAIVPMVDAERVCLIRNYRVTVERTLLEIPAGTLEPGEDPLDCAARELQEETGFTAGKLEKLAAYFMSPGVLSEKIHLFLATDLHAGDAHREPGEEIENHIVPWAEALSMVERGEIDDAKTAAALLFLECFRNRRRSPA